MDAKIKKCCPNCSQLYHLKSASSKSIPNIPLLLACGHSMCESCIRNLLKFSEPIQCKVCLQDMEFNTADTALLMQIDKKSLYKLFPINVYMVGELTLQEIEPKDAKKEKGDDECYINIKSLIENTETKLGECVECHGPTTKMCQQCATALCNNCFYKTHKNFIVFKNHQLCNIEFTPKKNDCEIHKNKCLDYYCKDCTKSICLDCMMVGGEKSCKNHNVTSIQEVNETLLSDITALTPKVNETLRRLSKTAVDIGNILTKIDDDLTSSEYTTLLNNVEQHFSKINAIIQKQKEIITSKLLDLKDTQKESLKEAKNDVAEAIKKVTSILNTINSLDLKKKIELNLATVLEDARQIINAPWYLNRDESDIQTNIIVKEDLYPLLSDYIKLEGDSNPKYKLYTTTELAEKNVDIPAAPTSIVYPPELVKDVRQLNKQKPKEDNTKPHTFVKDVPTYRSTKTGSCSSLNLMNIDSSQKNYLTYEQRQPQVESVLPFPETERHAPLYEGSQELIYVSHIVDPYNLYVQRASQQDKVEELLREFRNAASFPKPSTSHVTEGKIYLVYNKADNLWQRCRVVSIDKRNVNKPMFQVFCIDFGSIEVVSVDKLRLLPPARIQSPPPFAINCCLANCEPIQGSWTSEDAILIQNIIDNKRAVIHVRRIRATESGAMQLECDITTFDDGVSLAHALAFHERAKIPKNISYPKMKTLTEKPKLFITSNDYKHNSKEEVYITHIVNPDNFFVRKQHLKRVFEKLCEDLDQEYSLNGNTDCVYLPEKNMVCVANVEKCALGAAQPGAWARGVVLELPGRGRVRLLLPDIGAQVLLHWSALRRIHPKFTVLKGLAAECHLAGVTPHNKKWSPKSVNLLEKFMDRCLELHVEESQNRGSLGVTLYDKSDEENPICINTEMIKHKFAYTFGIYTFNKNNEMENLVYDNKSPLDEPQPRRKPKNKDEITILKRSQPLPTKPKEDDLKAKDKGPLRIEAKVLNYQSPSLIYVSLVHQQKVFNELFEKIQKYYSTKKTQGKGEWKVGDRCCTVCAQSQTWRRAAILALDADRAKVFYSDFACVESVPVAGLRELPAEFASVGDAAITCHLAGVVPAGGDDWPSLSKEYLKDLLDVYKRVFITKLGQFKDKSMPVEMWVYHTIQGGALEPNISEWRCLNRRLVEQGLAIPEKSEESDSTDFATARTGDDNMLSFLNITGSVQDWLQIEPMPMKPLTVKPEAESNNSQSSSPVPMDKEEPHSSNTIFISDWLPPEPFPCKEFTAMPTYIDNDGVIYLHDISQQDTLELIRKALDLRFKDPDPKAKFVKWTAGEPCIALFFLDNRFYRGRVIEVNDETSTCLIHYIDYGNEEMCSFENIRKSIALYQIPIQAHKCILDGIKPVGKKWDRQALDYIHKSIVEKQCYVKVTGEPIGDVVPIELKYDKLWINEHLVDFELAVYKDGSKAVVRKFAPAPKENINIEELIESDSGPDYIVESDDHLSQSSESQVSVLMSSGIEGKDWNEIMQEEEYESIIGNFVTFPPFTESEFLCNITVLNERNKFELSVVQDHESSEIYKKMYAQLQSESHEIALNGIYENKACLALFPTDGQWYRALILQYSEVKKLIKVKFVDYGNVEILALNNVREISEEHLKLPPATVTVTLHGIQVNPTLDDLHTLGETLADTFLNKDPFHVKVIKADVIPSVELRDVDGKLIYDNLIKEKVFINCD
ncbi:RING finger protein 17 [Maniola jurtina]|uniref:RING finger protein 17 n=1 Tax=Maniola jurtina TaxID=191418 RepID=UPI001E68E3FA|nr:RING finger protein 17 [Maniola jurtina]